MLQKSPNGASVIQAFVYGLFLTCTSVLLWGGFLNAVPPEFDETYRTASYFACGFAHPVGLFAVAVASFMRPSSRAWRHPAVALLLTVLAGMLLYVQIALGVVLPAVGALTGGLLGFASSLFFCALQELVSDLKVYSAGIVVFSAAAISSAGYLLLAALPPSISVWIVLFACFPVVAVLCVVARKGGSWPKHPMFQTIPANNRDKIGRAALELWRPLLCIAFSAFLVGMIRADTVIDSSMLGGVNDSGMVGLLLASIVLLGCWRTIYERTLLSKLQSLIFPLIATSFLLLPFLTGGGRGLFVSLAFTVFSITSSLMVVSCARTARMYVISPVLVFAAFSGIVYLFLAFGALLSYSFGGLNEAAAPWLFAIALVAIYVLSMALTLGRRMTDGVRRRTKDDVRRVSLSTGAFLDQSSKGVSPGLSGEAHPGDPREPDLEAGAGGERAKAVVGHPASFDLERSCAGVALHYGLTPREAQVMTLMAHGRDVAFIADELILSKNTVRTHTKGVFAKLGVHSKQELIDIVYLFER